MAFLLEGFVTLSSVIELVLIGSTFQKLTIIYKRGNFVYHYWWCTSIYRPLSYPFRSLHKSENRNEKKIMDRSNNFQKIYSLTFIFWFPWKIMHFMTFLIFIGLKKQLAFVCPLIFGWVSTKYSFSNICIINIYKAIWLTFLILFISLNITFADA